MGKVGYGAMIDLSSDEGGVAFPGTMMDEPLLLTTLIERAAENFGNQTVVWYHDDESSEMSYSELIGRVRRLASALVKMGVQVGDRVSTFAYNDREHLELFLAVPAIGAVVHPLNIRVHRQELDYMIRHAGDSILVADRSLIDKLPETDSSVIRIHYGNESDTTGAMDYEELIAAGDPNFTFPRFSELSASGMCYTGGTTGLPKGIVYTHRSTVLHTLIQSLPDFYDLQESDVLLPFVPMFHANAWGLPYAAMMTGARLVMPGRRTDAEGVVKMLSEQRVTFSCGVPTVWHGIGELREIPDLSSLRMVVAGGSALSQTFLQRFDELGIPVVQGFGMTEANPLLGVGRVPARSTASEAERMRIRLAQGRLVPLVEARLDDSSGGELQLRGVTIAKAYYNAPEESAKKFTADGWMRTGDVAEISDDGVVRIVDRTKDLIKSGGEWIPSIDLENAILAHPAVVEAVVVAVPDDRWGERPAAFVVVRESDHLEPDALIAFLATRVAKWWIPETLHISADPVPRTGVGKFDKKVVRERAAAIANSKKMGQN